jgi:hypothetical protein
MYDGNNAQTCWLVLVFGQNPVVQFVNGLCLGLATFSPNFIGFGVTTCIIASQQIAHEQQLLGQTIICCSQMASIATAPRLANISRVATGAIRDSNRGGAYCRAQCTPLDPLCLFGTPCTRPSRNRSRTIFHADQRELTPLQFRESTR